MFRQRPLSICIFYKKHLWERNAMKKVFKLPLCRHRLITEKRAIANPILFNDRGFSRLRLNNVIDRLTYLGTDSSGAPARAHRWGRGRCEASTDLDLRTAPNLLSRGTSPDPLCPRIWRILEMDFFHRQLYWFIYYLYSAI